jgi:PAS domain-containing protein
MLACMWHSISAQIGATLWKSPDPAFIVDVAGTISAWNNAAELFFGVPAEDALGQPCALVVRGYALDGEPLCSAHCPALRKARLLASPAAVDMTVRAGGRPSRRASVHVHHLTLTDSTGNPTGILHLLSETSAEQRPREPELD